MTRSWTGAASALWSDPANWSPAGLPAAADTLVFPAGVTRTTMTNDLPAGTAVGPMDFRTGYTLNGNALTLTGNLTFDQSTYPNFLCNVPLTLGASVRLGAAITSNYTAPIDVNGHTLTVASYNTTISGPLNGTGRVVVEWPGISVTSSGNFSGTIEGAIDLVGSMPGATLVGGLSGNGSIGAVTLTGPLYLGSKMPCCGDPHGVGTLQTKSIQIGGPFYVDLAGAGASDQLQVTGSVALSGSLHLTMVSGAPSAGQSFTLIDNDGTDAVSGTFSGLPEGATITLGGAALEISYAGGDGNDVVLTAASGSKSWTGASSALWSDPANWSPAGAPAAGEELIFPAGVTRTTMTNDLPAGFEVGGMDFRIGYTLNGNALKLSGDLSFDQSSYPNFACNVDLQLTSPVRLGQAITSRYGGDIDVNGHTLTIDSYNTTLAGALNGSGAIVVTGVGASFSGGGTFSGTVSGVVDLTGSMPNASFVGSLSGSGTAGAVTINGQMYLGEKPPCCGDTHAIGTLRTQSLSLGGPLHVDLATPAASDALIVSGVVTLGADATLAVSVPGGAPAAGQIFTLIDNDGSDAVDGTFAGLAEGAEIAAGGAKLTISYRGGDGNDVVLTVVGATKSWTGAKSALWSDPANWSPAAVPVAGEALLFPAGLTRTELTNDLPAGFHAGALAFKSGYTLSGNALTLTGDLSFDQSTYPNFVCNVDLKLGAPVRLGAAITSRYTGALDVNGHTLTVDSYNTTIAGPLQGSGTILLEGVGASFTGGGTFSGSITGSAQVAGVLAAATFRGSLSGNGTVGDVTIDGTLYVGAKEPCCADAHDVGTLQSGAIAVRGAMYVDVTGNSSDALRVTGTVTLDGAVLYVSVPLGSPVAGQTFTIIDNDGADAIAGTFEGAAEGAVLAQGPWKFRISYVGGDGNDVVLTTIEDTVTTPEQNKTSVTFGETATITAKVTGRVSTPVGSASLTENGVVLDTAPLVNGFVSFSAATFDPGVHTLGVVYEGTPVYTPSAATITHEVLRGKTTTAVRVGATALVYGDPLSVSIEVAPVAPAVGTPSGSITLRNGGSSLGAASLNGSTASIASLLLGAGTHSITAAYDGDTRFAPSDSAAASIVVAKAPTVITASAGGERTPSGTPLQLTVNVSATHHRDLPVSGVVTVSANGTVLLEQSIDGKAATLIVPPLPAGEHHLLVSFGGSANFDASSTTVNHAVGAPALFVRDVIVDEGNAGESMARVAVELSAAAPRSVTVFYGVADGSARAGEDYRPVEGMLTFLSGETVKVIEVPVLGDAKSEDDETLTVILSSPAEATLGRATATVTIANEDLTYRTNAGIVYASPSTGPLTLDLYTPVEGSGPFPLILWIPGGASYDPHGSIRAAALRATGRGYAVAVVRYRAPRVARFPAQLDDLRGAIRWLRANAAEHRLDADRIAAWGFSSGAHLASLLGTTGGDEQVQAVVAWGGPSDLTTLQRDADAAGCTVNYNDRNSAQSLLLGCALPSCAESAAAASPLSFVTRDDAAFLIMHAPDDCSSIPTAQSTRLYEALRAAGVTATLRAIDDGSTNGWAAPSVTATVETFLDAQLKARAKRRATRH